MTTPGHSGIPRHGAGRDGRAGRWWRTDAPAGGQRGALQLDPAAIDAPGALDRVVSTVSELRRRRLPGVLPVEDLVSEAGRVWLLTGAPAEPTVAQQLASAGLPPPTALAVMVGTGRALAELHRAGLVHGAFGPDTVVLDGSGAGWLVEVGLLPALRGQPGRPADDESAWAALARTLAAGLESSATASLLHRAATTAESAGLVAAVELLTADPAVPTAPLSRAAVPAGADQLGTVRVAEPTAPGSGAGSEAETWAADTAADAATVPVGPGTGGGAAPPPTGGPATNVRFGPGVGAAGKAPAWRTGSPARPRRRRWRPVLSGLLTFAILGAVVGYLWWQRQDPLAVAAVEVAPAEPVEPECDITVDVVGTVHTTGSGGVVTYQWIRSDGEVTAVQDQRVAAGAASTQVHLFWSFSGEGSYDATATLKILKPNQTEASGTFTYSCS